MGGGGGKFIIVDIGGGGGTCDVDIGAMEGGGGMAVVGGRCVSGFSSSGTFGPIRSLSSDGLKKTTEKSQILSCVANWLRSFLLFLLVALLAGCAVKLGIREHNSGALHVLT